MGDVVELVQRGAARLFVLRSSRRARRARTKANSAATKNPLTSPRQGHPGEQNDRAREVSAGARASEKHDDSAEPTTRTEPAARSRSLREPVHEEVERKLEVLVGVVLRDVRGNRDQVGKRSLGSRAR